LTPSQKGKLPTRRDTYSSNKQSGTLGVGRKPQRYIRTWTMENHDSKTPRRPPLHNPKSLLSLSGTHTMSYRILGIYCSPDGDFSTQLQILKKKADSYAHCLRSPQLTPQDIHTFHRTMYGPSMRYVLPALAID
jgi:hypothetical protein